MHVVLVQLIHLHWKHGHYFGGTRDLPSSYVHLTTTSLPSVWPLRHSAKSPSPLPSRCTYFILLRVVWTLGKVFSECPMKNTRQTGLCRVNSSRVLFVECYKRNPVVARVNRRPVNKENDPVVGLPIDPYY